MRLPERLMAIASGLTAGGSVADIGLDHALLSIYLVQSGRSARVVGIESQEGPYSRALQAVETAGLSDKIELRFGSGLIPLQPGEVDEVVIAGMGGETIAEILDEAPAKAPTFRRYVFQPMTRAGELRARLAACGWPIVGEKVVFDQGRHYVIIFAIPGLEPYTISELEQDIGPYVLKQNDANSRAFKLVMLEKYKTRLSGLEKSRQKSSNGQSHDILLKIEGLEAAMDVLEG